MIIKNFTRTSTACLLVRNDLQRWQRDDALVALVAVVLVAARLLVRPAKRRLAGPPSEIYSRRLRTHAIYAISISLSVALSLCLTPPLYKLVYLYTLASASGHKRRLVCAISPGIPAFIGSPIFYLLIFFMEFFSRCSERINHTVT